MNNETGQAMTDSVLLRFYHVTKLLLLNQILFWTLWQEKVFEPCDFSVWSFFIHSML